MLSTTEKIKKRARDSEEEEEEKEEGSVAGSSAGSTTDARRITALQKEVASYRELVARLRMALSHSNAALTSNCIDIPENAKMINGDDSSVGPSTPVVQRAISLCVPRFAEPFDSIQQGKGEDLPYRLDLANVPDTSEILTDTIFSKQEKSFPHAMIRYSRTSELLAPHVHERRPISLTWKLTFRNDPKRACSERDLNPTVAQPKIYFRLKLVYADNGTTVTMDNLSDGAAHLSSLSEPNILNSSMEKMSSGLITFKLKHLKVFSSHTNPIHRKFRFELECLDETLKKFDCMHAETFDFYSVSRIRKKSD